MVQKDKYNFGRVLLGNLIYLTFAPGNHRRYSSFHFEVIYFQARLFGHESRKNRWGRIRCFLGVFVECEAVLIHSRR